MEGVGRVTSHRLFQHFESLEDLRSYPREFVLTRLKGLPRSEQIVHQLFDDRTTTPLVEAAQGETADLAKKGVTLVHARHPSWPTSLNDLSASERPPMLWCYGRHELLPSIALALLAAPPLTEDPFERSQQLARQAARSGRTILTLADSGFDVAVQKIVASEEQSAGVMLADRGLARVTSSVRPAASHCVRSGGALVSPFPMDHGPFDHDAVTTARLATLMADATLLVDPQPDSPVDRTRSFAEKHERRFHIVDAADSVTDLERLFG